MSVDVKIEIPGSSAYRHLQIHRISTPELDEGGKRDRDQIGDYVVTCTKSDRKDAEVRSASFTHRYGDDLTVLVGKAGEALREAHGHV